VVLSEVDYDIVKFLVVLPRSYILPKRVGVQGCGLAGLALRQRLAIRLLFFRGQVPTGFMVLGFLLFGLSWMTALSATAGEPVASFQAEIRNVQPVKLAVLPATPCVIPQLSNGVNGYPLDCDNAGGRQQTLSDFCRKLSRSMVVFVPVDGRMNSAGFLGMNPRGASSDQLLCASARHERTGVLLS